MKTRSEHMSAADRKGLRSCGSHECAPKDWRGVPKITGDYDLDATILHRRNTDLPHRLALYTRTVGEPYHSRGAYHGYAGYHGDE